MFDITQMIGLERGRETPNFQRFRYHKTSKKQESFSIVLIHRTIDLEANSKEDMNQFYDALDYMLEMIRT